MERERGNPVFVAVRRLRWGFLIRAVAGEISEAVCRERLVTLANFAYVSGLTEEAAEIMQDAAAMEGEESCRLRAFWS